MICKQQPQPPPTSLNPTALQGYSRLLRATLDAVGEAVVVIDDDGVIVLCNRVLEELVSLPSEDLELREAEVVLALFGDAAINPVRALLAGAATGRHTLELNRGRLVLCDVTQVRLGRQPPYRVIRLRDVTTERHELQKLEQQALHDRLTGLANRELLVDRLELALKRSARGGSPVGVLFIDLDGFKEINDLHGHAAGDRVLVEVGRRLHGEVRSADTVSRLGGDEFVVLCEDLDDERIVDDIAARIQESLSQPYVLREEALTLNASVGVVLEWDPAASPEQVLARADAMMYSAKRLGTRYEVVSAGRPRAEGAPADGAESLRRAINQHEFQLEYLPVVALADERIVGVEALLRWQDPELGRRTPGQFLALAEQTMLIRPVGEWVIRCAAEAVRTLTDRVGRPVQMHVNLSASQLSDDNLVAVVSSAASQQAIDIASLSFDIAESLINEDPPWLRDRIAALRSLGCPLLADDVTQLSAAPGRLPELGFTGIKLDRTVVARIHYDKRTAASARAVVARSLDLGLWTIGEGVETEEQLAVLRGLSCDAAQGYALLGLPRALSSVAELIR